VDPQELMQLGAARQKLKQEGRVWTEAKNRQLVQMLDTNNDGQVSCEEFVRGFGDATPKEMEAFGALMMEYEAVARWVRSEASKAQMESLQGLLKQASTNESSANQVKQQTGIAHSKQLQIALDDNAQLHSEMEALHSEVVQGQLSLQTMQDRLAAEGCARQALIEAQQGVHAATRDMMLGDVFRAFDVDGSGFVDAEKLMQLGAARQQLKQRQRVWTEAKNSEVVATLAKDADNRVSREEFAGRYGESTPSDLNDFVRLFMEFEAVARLDNSKELAQFRSRCAKLEAELADRLTPFAATKLEQEIQQLRNSPASTPRSKQVTTKEPEQPRGARAEEPSTTEQGKTSNRRGSMDDRLQRLGFDF